MKLLVSALLLCLSFNANSALNGDEQCIKWTEHEERIVGGNQPEGPAWVRHRENHYHYWTRKVKSCVGYGPSYINKVSNDIATSLNTTLQKNNSLMVESLDKIEDIVGQSMELQYNDFIKKLKSELEKIKSEIKK